MPEKKFTLITSPFGAAEAFINMSCDTGQKYKHTKLFQHPYSYLPFIISPQCDIQSSLLHTLLLLHDCPGKKIPSAVSLSFFFHHLIVRTGSSAVPGIHSNFKLLWTLLLKATDGPKVQISGAGGLFIRLLPGVSLTPPTELSVWRVPVKVGNHAMPTQPCSCVGL